MTELYFLYWLSRYFTDSSWPALAGDFLWTTFALWIAFAFLMALKRRAERDAWPRAAVLILRALFAVGYRYDIIYNSTFGTLLFLQWPKKYRRKLFGRTISHRFEPLTARLKRLYPVAGWRGNLARLFCWLIHKIDKGHCL